MPRYPENRRESAKAETRCSLLRAATLEFAREGYSGANINRISLAAGFAKGTVYSYFASKHALMLAVIDDVAAEHIECLSDRVLQELDPCQRLESFFVEGFSYVADNINSARMLSSTLQGPHVDLKEHMRRAYQPMFALLIDEVLVPGMEQGYFAKADPAKMAQLVLTIYLGTASHVSDSGSFFLGARQVAALVLNGLRGSR